MSIVTALQQRYDLVIDAPFIIDVAGDCLEFEYRIGGYGARRGMVVDKDWNRIDPVRKQLLAMGFGYSCFDLSKCDAESFQEVLDDWGKSAE